MAYPFEKPIGGDSRFLIRRNGDPWTSLDVYEFARQAVEMYRSPRASKGAKKTLTTLEESMWEIVDRKTSVVMQTWKAKS